MNNASNPTQPTTTIEKVQRTLGKRRRAEKRFQAYGIASILFGLLCLVVLFGDIFSKGVSAFYQHSVRLTVQFDPQLLDITDVNDEQQRRLANYDAMVREALLQRFPDVSGRSARREVTALVSSSAGYELRDALQHDHSLLGKQGTYWFNVDDDVDSYLKLRSDDNETFSGRLSENQQQWIKSLLEDGEIKKHFNTTFFTASDSREPEQAGILGAAIGSLLTLLVCLVLSFPVGVAAAIYLEEYAQKNRLTDFIEVNINNLAAVPSIIFGLLGLAIFINLFGIPRSVPLVGGLVLSLMTLPTIIIASRAAVKAVPPSIREAALGIGASKMQVILHHILPLAMPGMLTGTIIGMARALGESAPLLMIGMVAFIVDLPAGIFDPATALPVQIYLWADSPERAFVERTSAAIIVLLTFLFLMNGLAVWMRKRLERRW